MKRWVGTDGMLDSLAHRLKTTAMLSKLAQRVAGHHSPPQAPVQEASSVLHQWVLSPSHESQPPQQHWWADLGSGPGGVGGAGVGAAVGDTGTGAPFVVILQFLMMTGFMLQVSAPLPQASPSIQFMSEAYQ